MPTQVNSSSVSGSTDAEFHVLSNDLDDFISGGIGPDQADVKIRFEYISWDYQGKMTDSVLAVKGTCTPTDGSNENKEFEVTWTVGPKMSEVNIINDGGNVNSKARAALTSNSLWALFLHSLKDIDPAIPKMANGAKGIRELDGIECTIRRVKQPEREGLAAKNEKGYDRTYYTCLKLVAAPGETKRAGHKAKPAANVAVPGTVANAAKPATNGKGSPDILEFIKTALANANGSIPLTGATGLAKAVFVIAKAAGQSTGEANNLGTQASNSDFLIEQSMEHDLGWTVEGGVLTQSPA
jgi:hypothetical protein